jgi:hypothetical protein
LRTVLFSGRLCCTGGKRGTELSTLFSGRLSFTGEMVGTDKEIYEVDIDDFEKRRLDQDYNLTTPEKYYLEPDLEVYIMIAGHVAGFRGSREFYGIVLRRLDLEDET